MNHVLWNELRLVSTMLHLHLPFGSLAINIGGEVGVRVIPITLNDSAFIVETAFDAFQRKGEGL